MAWLQARVVIVFESGKKNGAPSCQSGVSVSFLGDLEGGEPVRLTFNEGFDGFPSVSPDGTKMLFARSEAPGFGSPLYTYVMDISSLNIGPKT